MLIQPISRVGFNQLYSPKRTESVQQHGYRSYLKNAFVSFRGSTSAGQPFRKLKNVPDAFFGGITISSSEIERIKTGLLNCNTVKKSVKYLKSYEPYMLKTEQSIFQRFEDVAKDSPRMQFQDILQKWYDQAWKKLRLEEFAVLNDIDKISMQLSTETAYAVILETTNCRKIIVENNPNSTFKRKTVLSALENIPLKNGEEKIMNKLMERAIYLPTSATSENAFIVKYANRSHNEISNRLISPSVLTIDHVLASSQGGPDDISNFIPVSAGANCLKQDMWFKKFIRRFPQVVENCQKFIDFMIGIINNGGFKGNQSYPFKIQERLIQESGGKVKLDLSLLKYTKEEAQRLEEEVKNKKYNKRRMDKGG